MPNGHHDTERLIVDGPGNNSVLGKWKGDYGNVNISPTKLFGKVRGKVFVDIKRHFRRACVKSWNEAW